MANRIPLKAGAILQDIGKKSQIPIDKNINPEWIKSLYKRGVATSYLKTKNELDFIGMPVGGINCGTLYLGGDGRLWLWDIFNKNQEGIEPKTVKWKTDVLDIGAKVRSRDGACYVEPSKDIRPLEQGFAIKITYDGKTILKELKAEYWDEISFEATYPIATIRYIDKSLPLAISLQAYSPFIPLDADNSGLPATILSFTVTNNGKQKVDVSFLGWLENAASKFSAKSGDGSFVNTVSKQKNTLSIVSSFNAKDAAKFIGLGDTGTMCLSLINTEGTAIPALSEYPVTLASFISVNQPQAAKNVGEKLIGGISSIQHLLAGKTTTIHYCISWHFANVGNRINIPDARQGNYYASKFANALAVSN